MKKYRARLLVFLAHKVGLPYFKLVRKQVHFPYTATELAALPQNTVGYKMHQFFQENTLELLPYYEKHDIKHVVLGYPPTEQGEVCLQTFMLANGRCTIPVLIAVTYGWATMPEFWSCFRKAWQRGRSNIPLGDLDWIALVPVNIDNVRSALLRKRSISCNI